MKTKDRIKEEIGLEKLLLIIAVAILSSFASWTWSNREIFPMTLLVTFYFLCAFFGLISLISFVKIKLKIKELDSYE